MSSSAPSDVALIRADIRRRKHRDLWFGALGVLALAFALLTVVTLFANMLIDGWARLTPEFLSSFPSRRAGQAGILSAWVGSLLVMLVTAGVAVPLGVAAGIWLEEYAPKHWITDIIEININNLAGVPSIIYGLLALGLFVYTFGLGQSIRTAGLTLALLILPMIIVATREAIRGI
ncbi:MAG TPA: phosphate ABC transporter, permease protein PstA, partial [Accumulibacter sp.]|nr:phosphate ABC transporter, permease protein PstA [Accumulibacter sp.]